MAKYENGNTSMYKNKNMYVNMNGCRCPSVYEQVFQYVYLSQFMNM